MSKPIAVLISDVHYNLQTVNLANAAMRQAINRANTLKVPVIVAGDLHDTKANLRGECVNAMIETFKLCDYPPYVLIGNHDKINEKSKEHSLNFLSDLVNLVEKPTRFKDWLLIPYCSNATDFLFNAVNGRLICHQGIQGGNLGDYIQDHSATTKEDMAGRRVISGHYHTRQDIELPNQGTWSYIGNPYTLSWGEAKDPEKGFQILYDDGTMEFRPTNLRKHIIWETDATLSNPPIIAQSDDLIWVKVRDKHEALSQVNRNKVSSALGREIFKLTLEPISVTGNPVEVMPYHTQAEILDQLLDRHEGAEALKKMWRGLCE